MREPVPPGTAVTRLLANNCHNHKFFYNLSFEEKAIHWYHNLLLHHNIVDDMTGFDNGFLVAYGMCTPCEQLEYYQLDPHVTPSHFMQGITAKVWGDETHEVILGASSPLNDTDV